MNLIPLQYLKMRPLTMTLSTDVTVKLPDSWQVMVTAPFDGDIAK